jgi:hypothetical protein
LRRLVDEDKEILQDKSGALEMTELLNEIIVDLEGYRRQSSSKTV